VTPLPNTNNKIWINEGSFYSSEMYMYMAIQWLFVFEILSLLYEIRESKNHAFTLIDQQTF